MSNALHNQIDQLLAALKGEQPFDFLIAFDQLCHLFFLKILDEEEPSRAQLGKPLFPLQTERYRWHQWCKLQGEALLAFVRDEVFFYMAALTRDDPEVGEHFRDTSLQIHDANALEKVVSIITTIEFTTMNRDTSAEFERYLNSQLSEISSADSSYIKLTPALSRLMLELTRPQADETLFDPCCSVGDLLIAAFDHFVCAKDRDQLGKFEDRFLAGTETSRQLVRISKVRLMLHGLRHADISRTDLLENKTIPSSTRSAWQVILAMPPMRTRTVYAPSNPHSSGVQDFSFLQLCMQSLTPGGRCAIVVPDAILNGLSRTWIELRRTLITDFDLLTVISLPRSISQINTGMPLSLLMFRRPVQFKNQSLEVVWFYKVRRLVGTATEAFSIPHLLELWDVYQANHFQQVPGPETTVLLPPNSHPPCCWWVKKEQLAQANFNLDARKWQPEIEALNVGVDPEILVNELLADYHEIVNGLENLLKEMNQ